MFINKKYRKTSLAGNVPGNGGNHLAELARIAAIVNSELT